MSEWVRSSACNRSACIEARVLDSAPDIVQLRNSETLNGFLAPRVDFAAFVIGCKRGDFDVVAGIRIPDVRCLGGSDE